MLILQVLLGVYLLIGFIYGTYILLFGKDLWYWYPVNVLFGVPGIIANIIEAYKKPQRII